MKKVTDAKSKTLWDEMEQVKINNAIRYNSKTGNCPICHSKQSGIGITCGDAGCMDRWLGNA